MANVVNPLLSSEAGLASGSSSIEVALRHTTRTVFTLTI